MLSEIDEKLFLDISLIFFTGADVTLSFSGPLQSMTRERSGALVLLLNNLKASFIVYILSCSDVALENNLKSRKSLKFTSKYFIKKVCIKKVTTTIDLNYVF